MLKYEELDTIIKSSDIPVSEMLLNIGVSRDLYSRWINRSSRISLKSYVKVVDYLDLENKLDRSVLYEEEELINYYVIKRGLSLEEIVKRTNMAPSSAKKNIT